MVPLPKVFPLLLLAALAFTAHAAKAQDGFSVPSPVVVDVCSGSVTVLSQQQTGQQVSIEVEIAITGCDGVCTGTLEYGLVFTDASGNEVQWQLAASWDWREVKAPFTLTLQQQALPNAQLKEVRAIKLGRCSCSTVKA